MFLKYQNIENKGDGVAIGHPIPRFWGFGAGFPVRAGAGSAASAWVLNGILELLCAGEG